MEETSIAGAVAILVDHNMEGQAALLWEAMVASGWLTLLPVRLITFAQVGLAIETSDRKVWRFAQERSLLLLTDNRNMDDVDSLEQTIHDENTVTSLPVLTIGSLDRIGDREYRERCAVRLFEIVLDLDQCLGRGRIYLP
jgi:hypothetical protein